MRSLGTAVRTGAELPDVIAEFSQRNALNVDEIGCRGCKIYGRASLHEQETLVPLVIQIAA